MARRWNSAVADVCRSSLSVGVGGNSVRRRQACRSWSRGRVRWASRLDVRSDCSREEEIADREGEREGEQKATEERGRA